MGIMSVFFFLIGMSANGPKYNSPAVPPAAPLAKDGACYRKVVAGHRRQCTQVKDRDPASKQHGKTRTECKDLPYYREESIPCKKG